MPKLIQDEFTALPMSRQQKWAMRNVRDGNCRFCAKPARPNRTTCDKHYKRKRSEVQMKAWQAVTTALSTGKIKRGTCEQCSLLGEAHHDDYSKPLDIRWLCHRHHVEIHGRRAFSSRKIKVTDPHAASLVYHRRSRLKKKLAKAQQQQQP